MGGEPDWRYRGGGPGGFTLSQSIDPSQPVRQPTHNQGLSGLAESPNLPRLQSIGLSNNLTDLKMENYNDWDGSLAWSVFNIEEAARLKQLFKQHPAVY